VRSKRRAPTPEREELVLQRNRMVQKDMIEQENLKVCWPIKIMRIEFHKEVQRKMKRYTCEVNPQANLISRKVKRVKRET